MRRRLARSFCQDDGCRLDFAIAPECDLDRLPDPGFGIQVPNEIAPRCDRAGTLGVSGKIIFMRPVYFMVDSPYNTNRHNDFSAHG